ncbi:hypothetical protein DERF_005405 [Dermatophagoides farinae]|uniref:Uncharacterized protein n=1 Tax=Dermatophagoides farinae TaxID=6954 RepID=A0A922I5S0_DERFA|nr:hypothetical protein DERF_005405 [Dermatophagoides farinae]
MHMFNVDIFKFKCFYSQIFFLLIRNSTCSKFVEFFTNIHHIKTKSEKRKPDSFPIQFFGQIEEEEAIKEKLMLMLTLLTLMCLVFKYFGAE